MKTKSNNRQTGAVSCLIAGIFVLAGISLVDLALATGVNLASYSPVAGAETGIGSYQIFNNGSSVAEIAQGEVGKCYGSNANNPYGPPYDWCATFASWCYRQAGYDVPIITSSRRLLEWFSSNHYSHKDPTHAQPGEIIVWMRKGVNSAYGHTGVVVNNNSDSKTLTVVEGNTSKDCVKQNTYSYQEARTYRSGLYGFGGWSNE